MNQVFSLLRAAFLLISFQVSAQTPCLPTGSQTVMDVNNVRVKLQNGGNMWGSDPSMSSAGYEAPKVVPIGSAVPVYSIFAGGLWMGGIDDGGTLRVAAQTYRQVGNDYWAGPLDDDGLTSRAQCIAYDHHWKVNRGELVDFLDLYRINGAPVPFAQIPQSILTWPAKGNPYAEGSGGDPLTISENLAPFVDRDGDGLYNPTQGDYPAMLGDQHIFWVFNDNGNTHSETNGQPLSVEVHANAFAYTSPNILNNVTFYQFKIVHKSQERINDFYVGIWVDGDLGCFTNDFVGCDTNRNMGIFYNGVASDPDCGTEGYGSNPPLLGIKILKGPRSDLLNGKDDDRDGLTDEGNDNIDNDGDGSTDELDEKENMGMSAFVYYNNDNTQTGNPVTALDHYNYLNAIWKNGNQVTYGGNGFGGSVLTRFMYPGDPSNPQEWSECSESNLPADRRFLLSSGPITLNPGAIQTLDFAVVWVRPTGFHCDDFNSTIGAAADSVQAFYDTAINVPYVVDTLTGIQNAAALNCTVFPNPFNETVNITLPISHTTDCHIQVFNSTGKEWRTATIVSEKQSITINTQPLPAGVYYLVVTSGDKKAVKKLVKAL